MFESVRKRFMCAFVAASVALGSLVCPVTVLADDDDDDDFLEDLVDLTPEEKHFIEDIEDKDHDGDIDEHDVAEALAYGIVTAAFDSAAEQERQLAEQQRQKDLADAQRLAALEAQKRAELEAQLKAEKDRRVTGIAVSTTYVTLNPGQTYQVIAYVKPDNARNRGAHFSTSNPSIATVDGSGVIRAVGVGTCVITATSDEKGYRACTTVDVNQPAAVAAQTVAQDANWTTIAAGMIVSAAPGATVNLVAPKAMAFDAAMINALKARPDVGVLVAYPYNGHTYALAVPAGYNLAAKMDKSGSVSFIKLAAVTDGKVITAMMK